MTQIPARFFTEATNFTEAVASFASYIATALPVNSVNVNTPAKKIMYHPWNLGGAKSFFFRDLGGLAPPSPCVEPPLGAAQADTRNSIEVIHADIGAVHANIDAVQANMGAIHADMQANMGAVGAAQVETREVQETVIHRLERLETSPVPKFVVGLDLNPSLSNEMTAAPTH